MVKVFVTGGSGFVGGTLIKRLRADGHSVRAISRSERSAARLIELGAEPVRGDLADVEAMTAAAEGCDWAFHCAANVQDWGAPEDFVRDNVDGTRNVLRACAAAGVKRFVHVGTEAGLLMGRPLVNADETAPLRLDSPVLYSSSKAHAEKLVLDANRDGFETVVIRPRWVWGPGDTVLLPRLVEQVVANKFRWIGGGHQRQSTTHVDNLVHGMLLGVTRGAPGHAYFVTDGDTVVFRDFIGQLLATQDVGSPSRNIPRRLAASIAYVGEWGWRTFRLSGRPPITRFSVWYSALECTINDSKARDQLGYVPVKSREEGLTELRSPGAKESAGVARASS
jgi:nucleoside-diphosphate-sugar epimerase